MKRSFSTYVGLVLLMLIQFNAGAELMISPTRVVFSERDRAQEIVLINSGSKLTTYRIEWQEKKALPGGGYASLTDQEMLTHQASSKMLRFSPKQVRLNPGERQIIKLALRKPKGLQDGEYRSHLLFRALPAPRDAKSEAEGMSMTLNLHMSYSLPVIVRQGKPDTSVSFEEYRFNYDETNELGQLSVTLSRVGKYSSFGNILAYWEPIAGGDRAMIARVNAYSVYPELQQAQTNLVWLNADFKPTDGKLTLVYEGTGEFRGKMFDSKAYTHPKAKFKAIPSP
ncbi:MAG: fimbria/pilus periplasmic chaperone [Paraglaciecola polaris]|uniref:fimbrial biogenesis chaperone n=1 Tax=Paraglaciecola polaris TaxID=222814 RepID=UPI00300282DE|tara:strand:+ start:885 stop:1733 length:849 start_codon:yes stop_codon:yes gene_type:complete